MGLAVRAALRRAEADPDDPHRHRPGPRACRGDHTGADRRGTWRRLLGRAEPGDRSPRRPDLRPAAGGDEQPEEPLLADAAERDVEGPVAQRRRVQAGVSARVPDPARRRGRREAAPARPQARRPRAGREPAVGADRDLEPDRGLRRAEPAAGAGVLSRRRVRRHGRQRHLREPSRRRLARRQRGALPRPSRQAVRAGGVGARGRRSRLRQEDLPLSDLGEPDEAGGLLRREAALAVRPGLEARCAGGVPPLHYAARRTGPADDHGRPGPG